MTFPTFQGVIPAHLLPFTADHEIDEMNLRRHLSSVLSVDGITGIATNAHASEVATLTMDEQQRQLDIVMEEAGGRVPVIAGIFEDGSAKAATLAKKAEESGADALLVFPSIVFSNGSQMRPEMAVAHYSEIAEATNLPMIAFLYPASSPLRIETDAIVRICSEIDNVVAVKENSNDMVVYERNYRALKSLDKPISVLSSFSRSLFASLCLGGDGVLSGHGSIIADLQVELFEAVTRGDLTSARGVWDRMYPMVAACYAEPGLDGHNRMKYGLELLGRIDSAHVRPPLMALSDDERLRMQEAVQASSLSSNSMG